jgi:hypothetical protein
MAMIVPSGHRAVSVMPGRAIDAAHPAADAPRLIHFVFRKYEIVPARSVSSISWKRLSLPR